MHLDGPLFDLIGKLSGRPCWKLIGEAVRERVEVYDGTLYFSDVWFQDRGVRAVVEEVEEAVRKGYLGIKLKAGRGSKWMEKEAGLRRDIEVIKAVRKAVGPKTKILVDPNNGYRNDFEGGWRMLAETRADNLYWIEEIFPEDVEQYTRLRERMAQAGMKTLIADGESVGDPRQFEPYLKPKRLVDVLQMDIRRGGFLANLEVARIAKPAGAMAVPHNWASQVGFLMGLHLAKAIENVSAAEDDRSTCDAVIAEGYSFSKGFYTVSDAPGLGIRINEETYTRKYRAKEVVVA
jgi:D-galactarolactone cycloisomerase